jgi:hypothetical protein
MVTMSQLQKNETFTLEVARRVKAHEVEAGPDGERLLQLVDEVQRLRADKQAQAAIYTEETAYAVAQRIASKFGLTGLS